MVALLEPGMIVHPCQVVFKIPDVVGEDLGYSLLAEAETFEDGDYPLGFSPLQ
jgi:hypothetical protein